MVGILAPKMPARRDRDFPDGELAGRGFHLRGRFVLQPGLLLDRGVVAGELGGESVVARVTTAEGGLDSTSTVAVHGRVGVTDFELFASLGRDRC